MSLGITEYVAIYGAFLSTVLAVVQIRAHLAARRIFHIAEEAGLSRCEDEDGSGLAGFIIFNISNGGNSPVTIRRAEIFDSSRRLDWFKSDILRLAVETEIHYNLNNDQRNPKFPITLKPGDGVELYAYRHEIVPDSKAFATLYLVLSHSLSNQPFEYRFSSATKITNRSWITITDGNENPRLYRG